MQMLQYRAAAVAGFGTQVWFGLVRVFLLAAFFRASAQSQPITLGQAIDYVWLGQAFLALLPWVSDGEVAQAMRSGNISFDRLRPVDTYFYWYVRAAGWMTSRTVPRALLMFAFAAVLLPLCGFAEWGLKAPADASAFSLFLISMVFVVALSSAIVSLLNAAIVAMMTDRGINVLAAPFVMLFAGNIIPLPLMPDSWRHAMLLQPFAGLVDIPCRLYFGELRGAEAALGLSAQVFWTLVFIALGRWALESAMARLQAQGG
jgi:ABC-2 type transport system permease protein